MYAKPIEQLIKAFATLPGVGRRTAERYVFYILKSGKKDAAEITLALKELLTSVQSCEVCWRFTDAIRCDICTNTKRDGRLICVVAEPQDQEAIEATGAYTGTYHILRGLVNPERERSLTYLKIEELIVRSTEASEIILALNPTMQGETTMMYLEKKLRQANPTLKVSRLARGLPMGSEMQYADEVTLSSALTHRTQTL
jgi:recombination protein RecR